MPATNCDEENNSKRDSKSTSTDDRDEKLFDEELGFFDFLEAVTDRIDRITNESNWMTDSIDRLLSLFFYVLQIKKTWKKLLINGKESQMILHFNVVN